MQQKNVQPYYRGVQPYITMWYLWGINKIYVLVQLHLKITLECSLTNPFKLEDYVNNKNLIEVCVLQDTHRLGTMNVWC